MFRNRLELSANFGIDWEQYDTIPKKLRRPRHRCHHSDSLRLSVLLIVSLFLSEISLLRLKYPLPFACAYVFLWVIEKRLYSDFSYVFQDDDILLEYQALKSLSHILAKRIKESSNLWNNKI